MTRFVLVCSTSSTTPQKKSNSIQNKVFSKLNTLLTPWKFNGLHLNISLENQWTMSMGNLMDTWEIQGYWIFQWHSPLEIPWDVEIRFYIPGGIVIGAYHRKFLFIITMIFMYTFRKTRLKILNVILRSTNDTVSIKNWSKYSCKNTKSLIFI